MMIRSDFEVAETLETVWDFFGDIPQVAACLPGAELSDQVGEDRYEGTVVVGLGLVKLEFDGSAEIVERREADKTIVVDAAGADKKGRGQAALKLNAALTPAPGGTKVDVALDLQLSGAAAQYGRGMIADVTAILLEDFAADMKSRLGAIKQGLDPDQVASVKPASGLTIGSRALRLALTRVFRRFFLPYRPATR